MQVTCIKCHAKGALSLNHYKSNGRTYKYYGIQHYDPETKKRRWCYIGKYESLPREYKMVIHNKKRLSTKYPQPSEYSDNVNSHAFREKTDENLVARRRFELLSWGPKPHMPGQRRRFFDRYTTGLLAKGYPPLHFIDYASTGRPDGISLSCISIPGVSVDDRES